MDSETLKSAAAALAFILAGLWAYLKNPKASPPTNSVLGTIGMEYGNREQTERLITQVTRCADSLAVLADKKTDEAADLHDRLLRKLEDDEREHHRMEQEDQRPRKMPPRR